MNYQATSRRVCYVVSNELVKVSSLLPSNKNRSLLVHTLVKAYGLLSPETNSADHRHSVLQVLPPPPADMRELAAYHDRDYLEYILDTHDLSKEDMNTEYGLEEDCPVFPRLADYVRMVGGATLSAAKALRNEQADVAICWDGGRHHAQKFRASGFCYVADCVLAILALRRLLPSPSGSISAPSRPRIMYLDLDLHFSDGVSHAFHSVPLVSQSPQVLTLSIHHAAPGFFPVSELSGLPDPLNPSFDPFTLSLPLERGASNATFKRIWPIIERVRDTFRPNYVIVQCGVDGLAGDPQAIWNWALGGQGSLGWYVDQICRWESKTLLLGGGGYKSPNAARAWTYLTSIALDRPLPLDADIPDHGAFPLYAPSFILDVPPGNMQDKNTPQYLQHVEDVFVQVIDKIRDRVERTTMQGVRS
ncbi:histone deacetylase complex protein [Trametes gibbosa]|nr:histone deacetylase complex protein [Trametes gibbosa]